jgi:hypothetical protein
MPTSGFSTIYHLVSRVLGMKKLNLKAELRIYLNTHSFLSAD